MEVRAFYDEATFTLSYVVYDPDSFDAVIIDPVLDYDAASGSIGYHSQEKLLEFIDEKSLRIHYILETHAHADHLSAAYVLKRKHFKDAKIAIGALIKTVQTIFKPVFHLPDEFCTDGSQFDELLEDGQKIVAGSISFKVMYTPGHTPGCSSYLFVDKLFVGDALFMPDYGTGRCDFPGGDAAVLYDSITNRIYGLPGSTQIFVGHDYRPGGRALQYVTSVGEQKARNIHLRQGVSQEQFVEFRVKRDQGLSAPKLLYPSVQVNIAAGQLPKPEKDGTTFLKIPVQNPFD